MDPDQEFQFLAPSEVTYPSAAPICEWCISIEEFFFCMGSIADGNLLVVTITLTLSSVTF